MRCVTAALTTGLSLLIVAGCSSPVGGNSSSSETAGITEFSKSGAPPIARAPGISEPLPPDAFVENACRAVAVDKAEALGLVPPGDDFKTPATSSCNWWTEDRKFSVALSFMTTLTAGLSEIYAQDQRDPELYKYFEPAVVGGYPALYADNVDDRQRGRCMLNVGVTDGLFVQITADHLQRGKGVCEFAARVGEAVITTMKEGVQ